VTQPVNEWLNWWFAVNRRAAWGTSRDPREVAVRPTATVITVFSCASFSEIIVRPSYAELP
jgi:hypothetical protein